MSKEQEEKVFHKTSINWYPGHMAKTKREIREKIDLIDVVFELIDSRIPNSSKNKEVDDIIRNKPRLIVMTKMDLCDNEESLKWKKYYERLGYKVIMIDLINDNKLSSIFDIVKVFAKDVNDKRMKRGLKPRRLRVLILGIPNVGKSTLINKLVGKKVTKVGNRPGVTKSLEWIRINNDLELLDTPGILWPRLDGENVGLNLASMTAIKEEVLNREDVCIYIIKTMLKFYSSSFRSRYKLNEDIDDVVMILDYIGRNIGAIRNNEIDYEKVYATILKDLREGYLGKVTFDRYEDR